MSTFPSVLTTFSTKINGQVIDASDVNNVQSGVSQLEAVVGVQGANSVVGTYEYFVKSPASNGGGHVQTANKGGTGQTAFTKGDILVARSASVLSKLTVGSDGTTLVADSSQDLGLKWGSAGINTQSFLSSGTWTKPSLATISSRVFVQLWGGGGGGGASANVNCAGGGGGGAYVEAWFTSSMLGSTELVVIGAGGASVLSEAGGIAGGVTVFGTSTSLLSAFGGGGGDGGSATPGGGGGGGAFSAGSGVSGPGIGGIPGSYGGSVAGNIFAFNSSGGSDTGNSQPALYSTGGTASGSVGTAIWGGAGGSGVKGSIIGTPGISRTGCNGGRGAMGANATPGSIAGGGGGAVGSGVRSGKGGDGRAIIMTFV